MANWNCMKHLPGSSWRHGNWENKFGTEVCQRTIPGLPGSRFLTTIFLYFFLYLVDQHSLFGLPDPKIILNCYTTTCEYHENQESTIGAAFFTQVLSLNEATIKFDIWDTAGQERYHSLAPMYYRGAAAAVVVYDITSMVTIFGC